MLTTYNHALYIRDALDSILAQRTDHDVKILVHDDASTDGTREIVEDYAARHPGKFKCILQEENQFQQGRRIAALVWPHYDADYIAYLDGDDLWTSPDKLQVQTDFMDRHRRCMICQTLSVFVDEESGEVIEHFPSETRRETRHYFEDLAPGNFLLTSAVVHRRSALRHLPEDFNEIGFGDYAKFALIARKGWIGLIHLEMAQYRVHKKNMWYGTPFEDRLRKTQAVQKYVARHASKPFDALWVASSEEKEIPEEVQQACLAARERRNKIDRYLGPLQRFFRIK